MRHQPHCRGDVIGIPMLAPVRIEYEQFIEAQTAEMPTADLIVGAHCLRFLCVVEFPVIQMPNRQAQFGRALRRRATISRPIRPVPTSSTVAGSGTATTILSSAT